LLSKHLTSGRYYLERKNICWIPFAKAKLLLTLAKVIEHLQTFLKNQPCCLEKGSKKMGLLSGTADRGTDQVIKFFDVIGCQVSQIGILAAVPDLLHWIKVRRIAR